MGYYRITYDGYIEGNYEDVEDAKEDLLVSLHEAGPSDLTVEKYNEETEKWE